MSEKIYVLLLRLHSAQFREAYGAEALQLFRDRARDEKGFPASVRLWLDLLADLAISIPRGYRHSGRNSSPPPLSSMRTAYLHSVFWEVNRPVAERSFWGHCCPSSRLLHSPLPSLISITTCHLRRSSSLFAPPARDGPHPATRRHSPRPPQRGISRRSRSLPRAHPDLPSRRPRSPRRRVLPPQWLRPRPKGSSRTQPSGNASFMR